MTHFIYTFLILAFIAKNAQAAVMPTYKGILNEVKFWENIFSEYESNQCVFHDTEDLRIIYDVKDLPKSKVSARAVNKKHQQKIRHALEYLAENKMKTNDIFKIKILNSVPDEKRNPNHLLRLSRQVRCQHGIADNFKIALKRSKEHLSIIKKEARALGLPEDIAYLPHLESGFNNRAHSKAGALGLWQLMPYKAREYGLRVNRNIDERRNVQKATQVALKSLKKYYDKTGAWGLALTSYNYGINGTMRAIEKFNTNDYVTIRNNHKTKIFGFASKNFYPSFLAVRNLAKKYEFEVASSDKSIKENIAQN